MDAQETSTTEERRELRETIEDLLVAMGPEKAWTIEDRLAAEGWRLALQGLAMADLDGRDECSRCTVGEPCLHGLEEEVEAEAEGPPDVGVRVALLVALVLGCCLVLAQMVAS